MLAIFSLLDSTIALYVRDLTAIDLVEDWVLHSVRGLANGKCKGPTDANFANSFVFNGFKSGWMIADFRIANANFTVWIWSPNDHFVVLIYNDDKSPTNDDTLNSDIVLQLDLPRSLEFSKDARTPHIHDSFVCHSSWGVPRRYFGESVRSRTCAHLVFTRSRVNSDWWELILGRVVANLAEIVSTEGPKLTTIALTRVVNKHQRVVLAARNWMHNHAWEGFIFD